MPMKELLSSLRSLIGTVPVVGLAVMTAGWTNPLRPPAEHMSPQKLAQDSAYMQQLFEATPKGELQEDIIPLDLADEAQYRFALGRLQASGKTQQNSPELYARLNLARQRAVARSKAGQKSDFTTQGGAEPQWCSHFLYMIASGQTADTTTYTVSPVVACNGGASYVYVDVVAYDTNSSGTESRQITSASGEQYAGGRDFSNLTITPSISSIGGRVLRAESLLIAVDNVNGKDQTSYAMLRSAAAPARENIALTHPRKLITNKQDIIICQQRGGTNCDYAVAGYSSGQLVAYPRPPTLVAGAVPASSSTNWRLDTNSVWNMTAAYNYSRLYLPLRGTFDSGARVSNCRITRYEAARARLHLVNTGRVCYVESSMVGSLSTGGRTSNFNLLADFSNTPTGLDPACTTERIVNEPVRMWLTIQAWADCGLGFEEPRFITATHEGALNASSPVRIYYHNSCVAEGTSVTLADGRVVPVEQVKIGDKVVASTQGQALTVTDVSRGNEAHPLVHLRDSAGHEVSLTETHPVVLQDGKIVAAKALKAKDRVKTDKGVVALTSVTRVPSDKQVYNLTLGTDEELLQVGKNGRTFFAGGFLVGDNATQIELETPRHAPVDPLVSLPKAWHKDYNRRPQLKQTSAR